MVKARTETFQVAINALLSRREEMMAEQAELRERLAILSNDVEALDRTLEQLGYAGDVKLTPRAARVVLFYRGELRAFLLKALREHGPQTSRQLAERLIEMEAKDKRDRRMVGDLIARISKALRQLIPSGAVTRSRTKSMGEYLWRVAP